MTAIPSQYRTMLRTYGKQLVTARRLAHFRRQMLLASGEEPQDDRELRRRMLIEKVAREIIDNMLVTGAENPLVEEIKEQIEREFDTTFIFEYPFMEHDLHIFRQTPSGTERLSSEEAARVLSRLWAITLSKVDETML